jgi:hypothetical protein
MDSDRCEAQNSSIPSSEVLREQLAALCHEQWSGWMRHLFERCVLVENGPYKCPSPEPSWVHRWTRQMSTPFAELPENKKDSDRKEADRILAIVNTRATNERIAELEAALQHVLVCSGTPDDCENCKEAADLCRN